jgi:hypothetical protein
MINTFFLEVADTKIDYLASLSLHSQIRVWKIKKLKFYTKLYVRQLKG